MKRQWGVAQLSNPLRHYAWGSSTLIPRFLGFTPDGEPAAELWMGAHDADPSRLPDGASLLEAVETDPDGVLGPDVEQRFGPRLPFLMKLLAAAEPLSLQVHPSSERARLGFAAENRAGLPVDAPERNYKDPSHKPELIFALTRFEGLAGFRDVDRTARLLRLLEHPWADDVARRLESGPAFQALRAVTTDLLTAATPDVDPVEPVTESPDLPTLLHELAACAKAAEERLHREESLTKSRAHTPDPVLREAARVFAALPSMVESYPTDAGILVSLLLNHVVLAPGEAMFLAAGVIHAYTSGMGVEIMASSDNVLRAGLTPKHVDVPELLRITDFTPTPPPFWRPVDLGPAADTADYARVEPPVDEFALTVACAPVADLPAAGPRIVLVLEGEVQIVTDEARTPASKGTALVVAHRAGPLRIEGAGRVAVGSVPAA